jgi:hypothetical protein
MMETDPVSETLFFFLVFRIWDDESKNAVILSVIHHRQNPLELILTSLDTRKSTYISFQILCRSQGFFSFISCTFSVTPLFLSPCFSNNILLLVLSSGYLVQMGCIYYSMVRLRGGLDGKPTLLELGISGPNAPWIWNSRRHKIRPHTIILLAAAHCSPKLVLQSGSSGSRLSYSNTILRFKQDDVYLLVKRQQGLSRGEN